MPGLTQIFATPFHAIHGLSLRTRFRLQLCLLQLPLCLLAFYFLSEYATAKPGATDNFTQLKFYLSLIFTGLILPLGFFLSYSLQRCVLQTTQSLQQGVQQTLQGDLSQNQAITGQDEIAQTARAFEHMNQSWSASVARVRSETSVVLQIAQTLSIDTQSLQQRSDDQAHYLAQTSTAVDDLSLSVENNHHSASSVNQLAAQLSTIAQSSGDTMQQAVLSMTRIQSSANQIAEIIGLIDGIAFQTNILALNAAVEAARAGEQGRGFAVVASEVRNLAQRSAQSSNQIRQLIASSVQEVKLGVDQIDEVNHTLQDIVKGVRQLAGNIHTITTASSQQQQHLQQVKTSLANLDQFTHENNALALETHTLADDLGQRAGQLKAAVANFRLRQGTADEAYALVQKASQLARQQPQHFLRLITQDPHKQYADRDMYVFAFDQQGQYLAFAGNQEKLKVNLFKVPGLDGKKLVADAFKLPPHGGWVDYKITNPSTGKVEYKTSFIIKIKENIVLGCGVYKQM